MPLRQRKRAKAAAARQAARDAAEESEKSGKHTSQESFEDEERTHSGGSQDEEEGSSSENAVEDVMRDNLELMLEIVLRIREDPDFASNIYQGCPRLQHLLDHHPDLRPVFEDPYLVKLNFEKVYRDAGGVLPDDPPPPKTIFAMIVSHPLFRVFRFLIVLKKIANCIMGGGMSFLRTITGGMCCFDDAADLLDGGDNDVNGPDEDQPHDISIENQENRESLNRCADHMEDPEVQERMNEILNTDDPEKLDEAIENDPELKALRDSNPLCEELMSDPETMRILVDPDNLRALGECPDLIEQDFANPDWSPPDVEAGPGMAEIDELHGMHDAAGETNMQADWDQNFDDQFEEVDIEAGEEVQGGDNGEDRGRIDGEAEEGGMEFEMGDEEMESRDRPDSARGKGGKKPKSNQMKKRGAEQRGNFFHNVGVGLTDMIAGELVGDAADLMGAGDGLGGLEDQIADDTDQMADRAADAADEAADQAADHADVMATHTDVLMSDDVAGNLEDGMDHVEEKHEEHAEDKEKRKDAAIGGGAGGAAGAGVAAAGGRSRDVENGDEEEEDEGGEEEKEKKGRFAFVSNFLGAVSTAAKEMVATELLGGDFGEELVEKMEEEDEEEEEDEGDGDTKKKDDDATVEEEKQEEGEEGKKKKRRGLFRRKKE